MDLTCPIYLDVGLHFQFFSPKPYTHSKHFASMFLPKFTLQKNPKKGFIEIKHVAMSAAKIKEWYDYNC